MEVLREWLQTMTSYLGMTYSSLAFVLAMEVGVVGLHFADPEVFGQLSALFFDAHTIFLVPVCVFPLVRTLSRGLFRVNGSPNPVVAIVTVLVAACAKKAVWFSVLMVAMVVSTVAVQQGETVRQLVLGGIVGALEYAAYACIQPVETFVVGALGVCYAATVIGVLVGDVHVYLGNLAFVVFDSLFRLIGETKAGFYGTIVCAFLIQYVAQLLKDKSMKSEKKQ